MQNPLPENNSFFPRVLPTGTVPTEYFDTETKLIVQEAEKQDISWRIINNTDIIQFEKNGLKHYVRSRLPSTTSAIAVRICRNKYLTKTFLSQANISTSKGYAILKEDDETTMRAIFDNLQKPLVLKPTFGTHGKGIVLGIDNWEELFRYITQWFQAPLFEGELILEEMFVGREHRIVASREKIIAIVERIPAFVKGDGQKTVQQLIEEKNALPVRNISQDLYPHIHINDDLIANLEKVNKTIETIPQKDEHITLRTVSNVMAGGEAFDRTDFFHPSVHTVVKNIFDAVPGLSWCGIDYMTKDISVEQTPTQYSIIELGEMPEFAMHDIPMNGTPRYVAKEFLKLMYGTIMTE